MKINDIPFLVKDMQNQMPSFLQNNQGDLKAARLPRTYQQLPKNFMVAAEQAQNRFLNNHLHTIDEALHAKLLPEKLLAYFLHQNLKYYKDSEITNHDGIFKSTLSDCIRATIISGTDLPTIKGAGGGFSYHSFAIGNRVTLGAELDTLTSGGVSATPFSNGTLYIAAFDTGISGETYNQISVDMAAAVGNIRLGVYRDLTSLTMSDLAGETGEIAAFTGYGYQNCASFTLPASGIVYGAFHQSSSNSINYGNGNHRYSAVRAYQALPSSIAVSDDGTTVIQGMKIRGN